MAKKVLIPAKYLEYANIFSKKLMAKFRKYFNINKYIIDQKADK